MIPFTSAAINAGVAGCCAGLATSFPGISLLLIIDELSSFTFEIFSNLLVSAPIEIKDKGHSNLTYFDQTFFLKGMNFNLSFIVEISE